jgi:hypothetical protein
MTTPNLLEHILEHPGLHFGRSLATVRAWLLQGEPVRI